ncbi:hypothetical protein NTJ56_28650 [Burkholderia contaminans]|uniref:hypothetical protein n=1 Tax=Burkholderia contaminans TaxID=488447 RepID=UPI001CF1C33F|nr:hypothetical protein [Burkholderia contaminans]MCA7913508.1 hypothetical protein [Burkholderia contaminans]UUX39667.1 hypothetical protein NTJ56_28650 [Burkholderia contaminans]
MSAELSGMAYDDPMTGNQSFIDKNEINNCVQITLKYFLNLPLTPCHKTSVGDPAQPEISIFGYFIFIYLIRGLAAIRLA